MSDYKAVEGRDGLIVECDGEILCYCGTYLKYGHKELLLFVTSGSLEKHRAHP